VRLGAHEVKLVKDGFVEWKESRTFDYGKLRVTYDRIHGTLLSEKEQPGSFWLNELAESFEWGYQDRVLAQVVDG